MGKTYDTSSVGYDLVFNGPATAEEYDKAAGRVNASVEDAVSNTIYRATLPKWQKAFVEVLAALTGVTRDVDAAATAKAVARSKEGKADEVLEKATKYIERASSIYAGDDKDKLAELAAAAQTCADSIPVDPSASVRQGGINKGWLAKAEDILGRDEDAQEATIAKLLSVVPDYVLDRDEDGKAEKTSLARLVGKFVAASI